jgi:hypothetical protein
MIPRQTASRIGRMRLEQQKAVRRDKTARQVADFF